MGDPVTINLRHVARGLGIPVGQIQAVVDLLDEGNTVPFITRFRKDQTGGLDEEQIRQIQSRLAKLRLLAERKETILRSIELQGKLTEKLSKQIHGAGTTKRLEDLYLPYKPKKQTLATLARSRGLETLANEIIEARPECADLDGRAADYVNPDREVPSAADALLGAGHILAERFSESAELRQSLREVLQRTGKLISTRIGGEVKPPAGKPGPPAAKTADSTPAVAAPAKPAGASENEKASGEAAPPGVDGTAKPSEAAQPESETPTATASATEPSGVEAPVTEAPVAEAPIVEAPIVEAAVAEAATPEPLEGEVAAPEALESRGADAEVVEKPQPNGVDVQPPEDEPADVAPSVSPESSQSTEPESEGIRDSDQQDPDQLGSGQGGGEGDEDVPESPVPPAEQEKAAEISEASPSSQREGEVAEASAAPEASESAESQASQPQAEVTETPATPEAPRPSAVDESDQQPTESVPPQEASDQDQAPAEPSSEPAGQKAAQDQRPPSQEPPAQEPSQAQPSAVTSSEAKTGPEAPDQPPLEPASATEPGVDASLGSVKPPSEKRAQKRPPKQASNRSSKQPSRKRSKGRRGSSKKEQSKKRARERIQKAFSDYFDYSEELKKIPPHRVLAINRGERAKVLRVKIECEIEAMHGVLDKSCLPEGNPHADFLRGCARDALARLILPSLERDLRREMTDRAEVHAVAVFAKNLRNLLLQPPVDDRRILAVDPGYRSGCKLVALDQFGNVLGHDVIFLIGKAERKEKARKIVTELVDRCKLSVVTIGNGSACREAEDFFSELIAGELKDRDLSYVIVNEAGASVYSTSRLGREEFPNYDATLRGAISIGRRLQDPLSELVKIDPANIGVGLYQHDVKAKHLRASLDEVVESCVNFVGVDINTASPALLRYVSGLNQLTARRVCEYRLAHGPFRNREELLEVPGFGSATFVQAAGFLRITSGDNPLDATWIHPESYPVATQVMTDGESDAGDLASTERLGKLADRLAKLDVGVLAEKLSVGSLLIRDIVSQLTRPGRDPRDDLPQPIFKRGVLKLDDLTPGMELTGTVLNVVDFGTFVDIGMHDSGLVHVSQLADKFVRDPHEFVAVGDIVKVWVVEVDKARRRVSLTMIPPGTERTGRRQEGKSESRPRSDGPGRPRGEGKPRGERKPRGKRPPQSRGKGPTQYRPKSQPKPVAPITKAMKAGREPMRSFSDLSQFLGATPVPVDDKKKKKKKKKSPAKKQEPDDQQSKPPGDGQEQPAVNGSDAQPPPPVANQQEQQEQAPAPAANQQEPQEQEGQQEQQEQQEQTQPPVSNDAAESTPQEPDDQAS